MVVPHVGDKVLDWTRGPTTCGHRDSHANTFENGLQQFEIAFGQALQVLKLYSLMTRRKLGKEDARPLKYRHFFVPDRDSESDVHREVCTCKRHEAYTIAWETSTLMTRPCNVGRTLLKHEVNLVSDSTNGNRTRSHSLKEAIPDVEPAAQWFFACRGEHRAAVERVRLPAHVQKHTHTISAEQHEQQMPTLAHSMGAWRMTICRKVTAIWLTSDPPEKISFARRLRFLRWFAICQHAGSATTTRKTSHVVHFRQPDAKLAAVAPRALRCVRHIDHELHKRASTREQRGSRVPRGRDSPSPLRHRPASSGGPQKTCFSFRQKRRAD